MNLIDVDGIIEKTLAILKANPQMVNVKGWHKVNGIIPGKHLTISIGCDDETYEPYTGDWDKGIAKIQIFASLDNRSLPGVVRKSEEDRLEYGERAIRQFARYIRQCLVENRTLGGTVPVSFPGKIEYVTADGHEDLHVAVISFEVDFYVPRKKRSPITVNEIDALFREERIEIVKGED